MDRPAEHWLIASRDETDKYLRGFSEALNEGAPSLTQPLYHYTTEAGLDGFLRNGELWASSIDEMDDPRETVGGSAAIRETAASYQNSVKDYKSIVRLVADPTIRGPRLRRFVACFCERADYLLGWRAYAADSRGYCLEFDPACFSGTESWYLAKVEYDDAAFRDEVTRILDRIGRAYRSVHHTAYQEHLKSQAITTLLMWLSLVTPTFKDSHYSAECEWRLVHMRFPRHKKGPAIQQRLRDGRVVRFVSRSMVSSTHKAGLRKVYCGARVSSATFSAVRRMVKKRFPDCEVVQSEILMRRP